MLRAITRKVNDRDVIIGQHFCAAHPDLGHGA